MTKNVHFILYHECYNITINMTTRQLETRCKLPNDEMQEEFKTLLSSFIPEKLRWDADNNRWKCGQAYVEDDVWINHASKQTEFGLPDPHFLETLDKTDYCPSPPRPIPQL